MDSIIWTLYKKRAVKTIVDSSFLYKEKKMSDEASVLKIKPRRNFLSRQMKVSTVKEKLRNASLSKFA